MYTFLVVEDERCIRDSVISILTELNGGGVLGAENGAAALALAEKERPDAVITDIMMPGMDGIALLKELNKRDERIVTAVLSGYDDFEFIQNAMSIGAVNYILKPFEKGDITKLYYKLIRKIRSREALDREISDLMDRTNEVKPYIRQRFYYDLIGGGLLPESFAEMRDFLGLRVRDAPMRIALLEIDEGESGLASRSEEGHICLFKIIEIMEERIAEWADCDCFWITNDTLAVIWCPQSEQAGAEELKADIGILMNELYDVYKVVLSAGISARIEGPKDAACADSSARAALQHKLILGSGQIFDDGVFRRGGGTFRFDTGAITEDLWFCRPDAAKALIRECFQRIREAAPPYRLTSIQLFCHKLLADCLLVLENETGSLDGFFAQRKDDLFQKRFADCSAGEAERFFCSLADDICGEIGRGRQKEYRRTVAAAKQLILDNYQRDIGIEFLSGELHYSKNYFGQLFKSGTGMSVSEYINQIRIQKAKELLATRRYRIYEIAEQVGFSDQQYFARVFKKIVGCMPSDYVS